MHRTKINIPTREIIHKLRLIPRRYYLWSFLFIILLVSVLVVFWPRHVVFSYAQKTCVFQPTLVPGLLRSHADSLRVEPDKIIKIGNVPIMARDVCIVPTKAPTKGEVTVYSHPIWLSWLRKAYIVAIPDAPKISAKVFGQKPISTSRPIKIPLATPDNIFNYKIRVGDKAADCSERHKQLVCDAKDLSLDQGAKYMLELERYFRDTYVATVARQSIDTLAAVAVLSASINDGQMIFAKPKSIELTTDKSVVASTFTLSIVDGDIRTDIPIEVSQNDKKIVVSWPDDLPRQKSFELVVNKLTAVDGSGLDEVYKLQFKTSGGPKVQSINIGTYKVPLGVTATITFDQPILAEQDMTGAVVASGGAQVVGRQGNKVFVNFSGVPRCSDVAIEVKDTLQSEHGITGGSAWRHVTRTICQSVGTIGTSVQGRAIATYSFGSGEETVVYTGAIHGSEASTRSLMFRWIDELEVNIRSIPAHKTIVVIPVINPDGYTAGRRTNANNVDLNRNFATSDWRSDITTTSNEPFPGGGGVEPLSEPESKALASYIASVRPRLVLSYHSIGALLAANQSGDSSARAATYARLSGYRNTTGTSGTFEYGISGTADDYYAEILGIPSVLIELGSHTDAQFARNREAMWAMIK